MTAISVSERLLEMAAFYTPLALTVTLLPLADPFTTVNSVRGCLRIFALGQPLFILMYRSTLLSYVCPAALSFDGIGVGCN